MGENLIDAFWSVDIKDLTNDREFAQYWLKKASSGLALLKTYPIGISGFLTKSRP
jgi:hypothetical protein